MNVCASPRHLNLGGIYSLLPSSASFGLQVTIWQNQSLRCQSASDCSITWPWSVPICHHPLAVESNYPESTNILLSCMHNISPSICLNGISIMITPMLFKEPGNGVFCTILLDKYSGASCSLSSYSKHKWTYNMHCKATFVCSLLGLRFHQYQITERISGPIFRLHIHHHKLEWNA